MAFTAEKVAWSQEAAEYLGKARATAADLEEWRNQEASGEAQLWRFSGDFTSYLLTRVEEDSAGRLEMVLVAGAGENARAVIAWATDLARAHQISSIRTHINRPGLRRIYETAGWHLAEWVMRISTDGQ